MTGPLPTLSRPGAPASRRARYERRVAGLLERLYEEETAKRLAGVLIDLARAPQPRRPARRPGCLLISYADTLRAEDETPLKTLTRFVRQHLGDAIRGVHILPFFPSSSDDGFAVVEYRRVDHHLGSWEDVQALSADYDLMFDLVINHCSRENLWFVDFVSGREPGKHYFITLPEDFDTSAVVRPRNTPLISTVHTYTGIRHVWNTFSADQVDLDFSNPDVLREFVDILFFYVAQGARLIRLDAVAFLWKRLGTSCVNLPETHAVVKILRLALDYARAEVQLVTETNVPHNENVAYFGTGDEAHVVYQFSLAPLLLYSYVFGDATYLTSWAAQLDPPPAGCTYLNFLASHDGIGLRPAEGWVPESEVTRLVELMHKRGGFVSLRDVAAGEQKPYEINIALFSAFGGRVEDLPAYLAAHTLLMSFQGLPALYIHALLATQNDLELVEKTGRTRSINRGYWSAHDLEKVLADEQSIQFQVLHELKRIMAVRDRQAAFSPTAAQTVFSAPPGAFIMRRSSVDQTIVVVASVFGRSQTVSLAHIDMSKGLHTDRLTGQSVDVGEALELDAYQIRWLDPA